MKVNDMVRIHCEKKDGMNGYGRLVDIDDEFGYVTNLNMPFQARLVGRKFRYPS